MNDRNGTLFVVATPIGNLKDITLRALEVLGAVDLVLVEDTRHASVLFRHHGISTPMMSLHEHNEGERVDALLERLRDGEDLALISDAGTPLVSDPGYRLVKAARGAGLPVTPVPGSSALLAALSVAGLPTDRFCFEGFPPARSEARRASFEGLMEESRTLVFYEAGRRLLPALSTMLEVFGGDRAVTVAREITKKFETHYHGTLAEVIAVLQSDPVHLKGEFVIVLAGAPATGPGAGESAALMRVLLQELPLKPASKVAAKYLGGRAADHYEVGLRLKG